MADSLDEFTNLDRMWDGQPVTNQEFDQVIEAIQEKGKKKEEKKRKKRIKKISGGGTSLHEELNPDLSIPEIKPLKPKEEGILVNLPVSIIIDGKPLEKGFYKVLAEKKENKIYILFYQSQYFKGKIEATETENDFEETEIDFAKLLPLNESFVKMIFGSIDFNAYAYIPYIKE